MANRKRQHLPDDFEINPPQDYPFLPKRSGFSLKHHPVLGIILLNICSISILFFFISGGHPIDRARQIFKGAAYKVIEEDLRNLPASLAEKDLSIVKEIVANQYGADKFLHMEDITPQMASLKRRYPSIKNSKGNLFLAVDNKYYYLSADARRLYQCDLDIPPPKKPGRAPSAVSSPAPGRVNMQEQANDDRPKRDEIYQDIDGTWKNY